MAEGGRAAQKIHRFGRLVSGWFKPWMLAIQFKNEKHRMPRCCTKKKHQKHELKKQLEPNYSMPMLQYTPGYGNPRDYLRSQGATMEHPLGGELHLKGLHAECITMLNSTWL